VDGHDRAAVIVGAAVSLGQSLRPVAMRSGLVSSINRRDWSVQTWCALSSEHYLLERLFENDLLATSERVFRFAANARHDLHIKA
jgi:hypothetical protein